MSPVSESLSQLEVLVVDGQATAAAPRGHLLEIGWLARNRTSRPKRRVWPMPRDVRLAVPDAPGIYRMLRTSGDVLYVGKAASLHHRVNSYFREQLPWRYVLAADRRSTCRDWPPPCGGCDEQFGRHYSSCGPRRVLRVR